MRIVFVDATEWSASQHQDTSSQIPAVLAVRIALGSDVWSKAVEGLTGRVKRGREPEFLHPLSATTFEGFTVITDSLMHAAQKKYLLKIHFGDVRSFFCLSHSGTPFTTARRLGNLLRRLQHRLLWFGCALDVNREARRVYQPKKTNSHLPQASLLTVAPGAEQEQLARGSTGGSDPRRARRPEWLMGFAGRPKKRGYFGCFELVSVVFNCLVCTLIWSCLVVFPSRVCKL